MTPRLCGELVRGPSSLTGATHSRYIARRQGFTDGQRIGHVVPSRNGEVQLRQTCQVERLAVARRVRSRDFEGAVRERFLHVSHGLRQLVGHMRPATAAARQNKQDGKPPSHGSVFRDLSVEARSV